MLGCCALRMVLISLSEVIGNPSFSFSIFSRFRATISSESSLRTGAENVRSRGRGAPRPHWRLCLIRVRVTTQKPNRGCQRHAMDSQTHRCPEPLGPPASAR